MAVVEQLNIGIVGAAGRGASFRAAFDAHPVTRIHAVCDIREEALAEAAERLGATESYTDYQEMIEQSEIDAVMIGTPMPLHVPQAIAALDRGLHVLSEVPAGVSIEECRELVQATRRSTALYERVGELGRAHVPVFPNRRHDLAPRLAGYLVAAFVLDQTERGRPNLPRRREPGRISSRQL